jgi:hypothetical protein
MRPFAIDDDANKVHQFKWISRHLPCLLSFLHGWVLGAQPNKSVFAMSCDSTEMTRSSSSCGGGRTFNDVELINQTSHRWAVIALATRCHRTLTNQCLCNLYAGLCRRTSSTLSGLGILVRAYCGNQNDIQRHGKASCSQRWILWTVGRWGWMFLRGS